MAKEIQSQEEQDSVYVGATISAILLLGSA